MPDNDHLATIAGTLADVAEVLADVAAKPAQRAAMHEAMLVMRGLVRERKGEQAEKRQARQSKAELDAAMQKPTDVALERASYLSRRRVVPPAS